MLLYDDFLDFAANIRGLSPTTLQVYSGALKRWARYLADNDLSDTEFSSTDCLDYLGDIKATGVDYPCVNHHRSVLIAYYDYVAAYHGLPGRAAWLKVPRAKQTKKLPISISEEAIRGAMAACNVNTFLGARNYMALITLYHTGIRSAEMRHLTLNNVDLINRTIKVMGKGRKERVVPLSREATKAIAHWLNYRKMFATIDCPYLFITEQAEPMQRVAFSKLFTSLLAPFAPREQCHAHALRHAFATTLLRKGVDITQISSLMGHTSIQTTFNYIAITPTSDNPFD